MSMTAEALPAVSSHMTTPDPSRTNEPIDCLQNAWHCGGGAYTSPELAKLCSAIDADKCQESNRLFNSMRLSTVVSGFDESHQQS